MAQQNVTEDQNLLAIRQVLAFRRTWLQRIGKRKLSYSEKRLAFRQAWFAERYTLHHSRSAAEETNLKKFNRSVRKRWSHKTSGTPETFEKASHQRQGSIARLYEAGDITIEELAAAHEIASVAERIGRDVGIRCISLETRVDCGGNRFERAFESLGSVRREIAYGAWRASLSHPGLILSVLVGDMGISVAAKRHHMRNSRAKHLLGRALASWPDHYRNACDEVSSADLAAAQAGLF